MLELHAHPENAGAVFQVASQFNCLEFVGPEVVPEHGVTGYASDLTQGPACSLAAAAATVVRNYFVPVDGVAGQTRDRQLDNLHGLAALLGAHWDVVNGYVHSDAARLRRLDAALTAHDRETVLGTVKVGLHRDVGVTFARRFAEPAEPTHVTQVFCSAISCGYSSVPRDHWKALATLVLEAAYEATLRAALLVGARRVWLTFLGGGVFGNRLEWIGESIGRALARMDNHDLDVHIAHYRAHDPAMERAIELARRTAR
ncbi:MAG TPA: hypothetical protein VFX59_25810 [Polyangiales bacterium]|nr:hypothetical protein [Polyangiales bacterium]